MAKITDMSEGSTIQFLHGITLTIDKIEGNRVSVSLMWRGHSLSYRITAPADEEEPPKTPEKSRTPLPTWLWEAFSEV